VLTINQITSFKISNNSFKISNNNQTYTWTRITGVRSSCGMHIYKTKNINKGDILDDLIKTRAIKM